MALTLKEAITATQTTIDVNGTDTLTNGDMYSLDDEYVLINTADLRTIQPGETAYQRVSLDRGVLGTRKAAHAAAATLTAVNIASDGGGSGVTVDNTVDAPFAASTLIAPGATETAPGEATLPEVSLSHEATGSDDAGVEISATAEDGSANISLDAQSESAGADIAISASSVGGTVGIEMAAPAGDTPAIVFRADRLSFDFNIPAATRPVLPATPTEQDIADALVALGLVTQAA